MTIEDPVEYVFPEINQIQTNEQAGLTFATGLRSILRQDPDVILVGEIRDVETARIAVQSALTGHLVLSSLHATDSVSALHRFLDMGIESFFVASSVIGIVGQRLVRRICPSCQVTYTLSSEERSFYEESGGPEKTDFVRGEGCNLCSGTGYQGRSASTNCCRSRPKSSAWSWAGRRRTNYAGWPSSKACAVFVKKQSNSLPMTSRPWRKSSEAFTRCEEIPMNTMLSYKYVATDPDGKTVKGTETAASVSAAHLALLQRGIQPTEIKENKSVLQFEITKKAVKRKEVMHFSRQLSVFVKAGIPIMEALETLAEETKRQASAPSPARHDRAAPRGRDLRPRRGSAPGGISPLLRGRARVRRAHRYPRQGPRRARRLHREGRRSPVCQSPPP